MPAASISLQDLPLRSHARITQVLARGGDDAVAQRLDELGFIPGETVRMVARGPLGGEPVAVQVGATRFALRRSEAGRVMVEPVEPVEPAATGGRR